MSRKSSLLIAILSLLVPWILGVAPNCFSAPPNKIIEKPIKAELVLKIGSDKPNEDFYKGISFALGKNSRIYILDSGNSRIQCFSKEGRFLFGFGKRGQGPGELSDLVTGIRILSDGKIYVIDNSRRRINIYDQEGKFLNLAQTSAWYNDIELINRTYYLSNIFLEENHKPIHVSRSLAKIDGDFGIFVEPAVGILKQIGRLPMPEPWRHYYGDTNFTKLIAAGEDELLFSQGFPYRLIKYDTKGKVLKDIMGDVDFDTYQHVKYKVDSFGTSMITSPADAAWVVLDVSIRKGNQIVVPFSNPEKDIFYIDIYDLNLNLISRYRLLNVIADHKKGDYIYQSLVDDDNNLYAVVISKEDYPQLVRYKLSIN